jgi:KRAB domain-containing zinc finger protein
LHLPEKPFQCHICSKKLTQKESLKKHLEKHESDHLLKDFDGVCEICSKKFATPSALKIHQAVHSTDKEYQCPHCVKKFRLIYNMKTHIAKVHVEKPYECTICLKKAFTTMEKLDAHREKHFSEKKVLPCGICHQTFKTAINLRKHLMKRHNLENESQVPNSISKIGATMPIPMPIPMKMPSSKSINNVLNLSQSIFQRHGHPTWL